MDVSEGMRTGRGQRIKSQVGGTIIAGVRCRRYGEGHDLQVGEESNNVGDKRQFFIHRASRVAQSNVETFGTVTEGAILAQDAADGQELPAPSDDDIFIQKWVC